MSLGEYNVFSTFQVSWLWGRARLIYFYEKWTEKLFCLKWHKSPQNTNNKKKTQKVITCSLQNNNADKQIKMCFSSKGKKHIIRKNKHYSRVQRHRKNITNTSWLLFLPVSAKPYSEVRIKMEINGLSRNNSSSSQAHRYKTAYQEWICMLDKASETNAVNLSLFLLQMDSCVAAKLRIVKRIANKSMLMQ